MSDNDKTKPADEKQPTVKSAAERINDASISVAEENKCTINTEKFETNGDENIKITIVNGAKPVLIEPIVIAKEICKTAKVKYKDISSWLGQGSCVVWIYGITE